MKERIKPALAVLIMSLALASIAAESPVLHFYQYSYFVIATNADGSPLELINGVPKNADFGRLTRDAEAGIRDAQYKLAMCLYDGLHGISTNYVRAYKWASLAVAQKQKDAKYLLWELELSLTQEQLSEGKAEAAAFLEKKKKN